MSTWVIGDVHGAYKALVQIFQRAPIKEGDTIIQLGDVADGWSEVYECVDLLLSMKDKYNMIFIKGNHDCLDEKTELFTKRGWLDYKDIKSDDLVLGINKNNKSEWQSIKRIINKTSNHLNYYSSDRLDMALTDNHRIIHKIGDEYGYKHVKDLKYTDRLKVPKSCEYYNEVDYNISDEEIKLTAWILTDGSISKKYKYITIYQSKVKNIKYIENLLDNLKLDFNHVIRDRTISHIQGKKLKSSLSQHEFKINSRSSKLLLDKLKIVKEEIPKWVYNLSVRQLNLFIKEIIRGDGSKYGISSNYILFGTYKFLSSVQPIFNISNYSANITKSNRGDFRLNITKHNTISIRQDVNKINRVSGKFNTWCLNVPFGNFLVRRNGISYFTGNCWFNEYLTYGLHPIQWLQGGEGTLKSYCNNSGRDIPIYNRNGGYVSSLNNTDIPNDHIEFFKKQLYYYIDHNNRCYVHGGFDPTDYINNQIGFDLWWDRDLWLKHAIDGLNINIADNFKEIFIGHTSLGYNNSDPKPQNKGQIWNLDTGAGFRGRLSIMNVDTKEYYQSDLVQELYAGERGRN